MHVCLLTYVVKCVFISIVFALHFFFALSLCKAFLSFFLENVSFFSINSVWYLNVSNNEKKKPKSIIKVNNSESPNFQILNILPRFILYNGTQTSIKVSSASSIKQWYLNFAGSVQFWMTARDVQFFNFALFSSSSFDSGQESTFTAEFFDQEQERPSHT